MRLSVNLTSKAALLVILLTLCFSLAAGAQSKGRISGNVSDEESGEPLAGANVVVMDYNRGACTDLDGEYSFELNPGSYELRVTYVGYKPLYKKVVVTAGEDINLVFMLEPDILCTETVVVLGTRRADRTVIESPVPVDVITSEAIRATGMTQTTEILQMLVPSLNAPKPAIRDGSDHIRPAMLRGLGPDQVLILVNGKRRHTSALMHVNGTIGRGSTGVDLNAIPPTAIERIEVLRDGASAQYGSDALAGVINIILKMDTGFDASVTYGQSLSSSDRGYSASEGLIPGEGASSYDWDGSIESVSYTDGVTENIHAGYGFKIGEGELYVNGQYRHSGKTNRAGLDPRQQYFTLPDGSDDPREAGYDELNHEFGTGELNDLSLFLNGSLPFGDKGNSVYAFGGISRRDGLSPCFFRRSLDDRTVRSIHPDGFLPKISTVILDYSFAAGLKGVLGKWVYDISESFGANSFEFGVENTNNASMGVASPTEFKTGTLKIGQASTNIDIRREYDFFTGYPLSVAVGSEFRWENYQITAGEYASYIDGGEAIIDGPNAGDPAPTCSQCFPGFSPGNEQDESRTNIALYADFENNLTERLMAGLAGRFENYSDFGSTMNGKLSSRYELTEEFALRGAASTGFRAPSLAQSYFSSVATIFINGLPYEMGTFPVNTAVARALGAEDLKAEKSVNLSGGVTFNKDNLSLSFDAYQIDITDRIVFTEDFRSDEIAAFLQDTLGLNANGGRYFTNALDTRTRGVDIIGRYGTNLGPGKIRLTAAVNFTETEITNKGEIDTPPELQQYTTIPLLGRVEQGRFEVGQPQSTYNFMANYCFEDWRFMLRTIRYGEISELNSDSADKDQEFSAKWLTDGEVTYRFNRMIALSLGSKNIFDVYPDKRLKVNSFSGIMPYSRDSSHTGFTGRYVYTRLDINY